MLLREGSTALTDPDGGVTHRRDVRVVLVRVDAEEVRELGGESGMSSSRVTTRALATLLHELVTEGAFALVGVGGAGEVAARLATKLEGRVDRLVLVAVPVPEAPLDRDDLGVLLGAVQAKTLILNGQKDPDAAAAAAEFHRARIGSARVEMVPPSPDDTDPRLALTRVWERVLSFAAPRTGQRSA